MITTKGALLVLLLSMTGVTVAAQDLYSVETKPPRGFMPNTDHLSSPLDDIDVITGKLHLNIPLASLPAGRGGAGFELSLVYDSHIHDLIPGYLAPPPPYTEPARAYQLTPVGTTGGWHFSVENYKIEIERRNEGPAAPDCPGDSITRVWRVRVGLADGSLHVMHLKGYEGRQIEVYSGDGFFGVYPSGWAEPCAHSRGWPYLTGWQTYYSSDGTYLRLEILADASQTFNQLWYLYFPDGRRLTGHGSAVEALYDANGNGIHFIHACYDPPPSGDCSLPYEGIVDDVGREIRLDYNITDLPQGIYSWGRTDRVTASGPNGPMIWTINWETVHLGQTFRTYPWSEAPWWPNYILDLYLNVVQSVQLPLAPALPPGETPPVWNSYVFAYADDADNGYGEVDSMRTPTGALYQYRYLGEVETLASVALSGVNAVRERKITHDGEDLVWTYYYGVVTAPDGSQTRYNKLSGNYIDPADPSWSLPELVYSIEEPNGAVRKRMWARNRIPGLLNAVTSEGFNVYMKKETFTVGNASGTPSLTAVTDHIIDKNGNPLNTSEYQWVAYDPSGPETGAAIERVTQSQYYAETPDASSTADDPEAYWNPQFSGLPRRLNALRRQEVSNGAGAPVAVTEFDYDEPLGRGNPTATKRWDSVKSPSPPSLGNLNSNNSQVQRRSYGAYGNLEYIYDSPVTVNGPEIPTHISYESSGSFPNQVDYAYQTPEQRSWAYDWNVAAGTISSKTDLDNNVTTTYTYDNVGRQRFAIEANIRQTETLYDDPNMKVTVKKDVAAFADGKLQVTSEYDQLGRVALARTSEPGNPDGIKVKTAYYPTLNRTVASSPYRTTADATLEWTCTQTDASKRVTAVAVFKGSIEPTDCESTGNRTGITRTAYDSNWTRVIDPASKVRDEGRDALGQLVQVIEDPNGFNPNPLNYQTSYGYDALGNLTQVNQGVQSRTFQYSSLGRLLSATNPESGPISYTYADSGDLLTRTDARGIVATFTYDPLHRIRTKTYSDGTPAVTYTYYLAGVGSPKVGQLQSVFSAAAWSQNNSYDALGRVTSSSHTIAGDPTTRNFLYTYWLNNSVQTVTNPSGRVIQYDLDDAGRIARVYAGGTTYADLTVTSTPYTADGKIAQMKLGNNLWETRTYQTPGTPTLFKLGTSQGANDKLELEYNFSATANNGNLESHVIRQPGDTWTQTYGYDGVNRLTAASEPGGWSRTYGYDQYGNRWVATTSGPPDEIHEPRYQTMFNPYNNRFTVESGITYDFAGNQTYYAPWTLGYDAENRNTTVSSGSSGNGAYAYDGDGQRVSKTWTPYGGSPTTTYYLYNALGQLAAEYSTGPSTAGTSYIHTDMLGSTRMVTNASGATVECNDYLPFGRMLSDSVNARNTGCYPPNPDYEINSKLPQKFTGKERDSETRLDWFESRYFTGAEGRFTSVDSPSYANRKNPQTWNLYAYVVNNPLTITDPTGHEIVCHNNEMQCLKDAQDATGDPTAAKRVKTKTITTRRSFLGIPLGSTSKTIIEIDGDVGTFRALSANASKLADLVTGKDTVDVYYDKYARSSVWSNGVDLQGGSRSWTPSQGYNPMAYIDPNRTPGVVYDPDAVAQHLPQANTGEEFGHEVLGHIWGELYGKHSVDTRRNMRDSIEAENAVRKLDPARGQKGLTSHHNYSQAKP